MVTVLLIITGCILFVWIRQFDMLNTLYVLSNNEIYPHNTGAEPIMRP